MNPALSGVGRICFILGLSFWVMGGSANPVNAPTSMEVRSLAMPTPQVRGSSFGEPTSATRSRKPARPVDAPDAADSGTTRSGYGYLSFRTLSNFTYPEPAPGSGGSTGFQAPPGPEDEKIPAPIRNYHNRDVLVMGYMLPLGRTPEGRVSAFLLMRDQSLCCFGATPRVNDFIAVKMEPGTSAPDIQDEPILVSGRLDVGAIVEEGVLLGLYKMTGNLVESRKDLQKK